MIKFQQAQINWTAVGIGVTVFLAIAGGLISRWNTRRTEKAQRRERLRSIVSDFQFTINKWVSVIHDEHERLPIGIGLMLNGFIDMRADALERLRAESIEELATGVMVVRSFLTGNSRVRLDNEWEKYKECEIEGIEMKNPETGMDFTSHAECKKGLIDCLEQMKKLASEIEI